MSQNIDAILDRVFEEDKKFLRKMVSRNKKVGIILTLIGAAINIGALLALIFLLYSTPPPDPTKGLTYMAYALILAFIGSQIGRQGTTMFREATNILNPGRGRYKYFSKLRCPKCGFTEIREKKQSEYIGMKTEDRCSACGEPMVIIGIYAQPEKEIQTIGFPLLPTPGQTITTQLKAAIMNILTPFKIAFRIKRNSIAEQKD